MRVLIVDDEKEFLELMEKRLARRGVTVSVASGGLEALEVVKKSLASDSGEADLHVVVLDVRMPDMDGLETLRQIKALAPSLPVLLLTGHAAVGAAMEGLDLGAYDYMLKPVAIEELMAKMDEAINASQS